jgi:bleomycin hydrolase
MKKLFILLTLTAYFITAAQAQTKTNKKESAYQFTTIKEIGNTEVKNQGSTGTCWSFSTLSFLESELERMGKGKMNLSEMYIARRAYTLKADRFVRMMGKTNFGQGGAFHDVMNVIKDYGLMPDAAYSGFIYGQSKHNHSELEEVLMGMLNTLVKLPEGKLSPAWKQAFEGVLDAYLGKLPEKVDYNGKSITPIEFRNQLGINANDYIEISSFTHHPFYEQFVLEVPDNWAWNKVYNVPLDEMEQIMENAITNNYSIAWASDVSEPYFSHKNGLAIVPEKEIEAMSKEEKESLFTQMVPQRIVTQELRQKAFDNLSTQDDHGMHITGLVKDQNGQKFYIVKNSWGAENNECGGYLYCSAQYIRYKTTCIMVHKNAIPQAIATKLKLTK